LRGVKSAAPPEKWTVLRRRPELVDAGVRRARAVEEADRARRLGLGDVEELMPAG